MNELLDVLEQGVLVWDGDGRIRQANAAALEILGDEDFIGTTLPEYVLLDENGNPLNRETGPVARARESGTRIDQVVGIRRPDDQVVWLSVRSMPLSDGTVASTFIDITVQRRAEQRLEAFAEHSSDIVCVVDHEGRLEYVSPAAQRLLGWASSAVTGRHVLNFVHPEDAQPVSEAFASASPQRPAVNVSLRVRARDRTWRWFSVHAATTFSSVGLISSIELTASDVTDERDAQARLKRAVASLKTLVESATGGVVMEDAAREVTLVSRAFCGMFDIPTHPDALVGAGSDALLAAVRRVLADSSGSAARDREIVEAALPVRGERLTLADGRSITRDYVPIGAAGEEGHLWIFRDVTAATQIEDELRQARDAALWATTVKSDFIATMSHEIRTPLAGISGAAALMLDDELPDSAHELVEVVVEAAQALEGLLGDVLDVSRIEAGRAELEVDDYDVRRLLSTVAGVLTPTLRDRPLELSVVVDASVPAIVRGDGKRVRQILLNLASNAVKYSERGRVCLHARAEGERLRMEVIDTGPGIDAATLARLFEPWTRGHGREWAGTGLGLGIARKLARAMGGDVTAASVVGVGSTFTLDIPLVEGDTLPPRAQGVLPDVAGMRVLVAEDNQALRGLLNRQLQRLGVHGTLVADGRAAAEAAATGTFDAILLDLRMPVMGGLEAAGRIRRIGSHVATPMFALTADTSAGDVEQCLASGMNGHLAKPVSLQTLHAALAGAATSVTETPVQTDDAWLDERQLRELADVLGGPAALDSLIDVFLADLNDLLERLEAAVAAGRPADVAAVAHALRSGASSFGATRLCEHVRELEDRARHGSVDVDASALERIADAVAATVRAMHRHRGGRAHHAGQL